MKRLVILSLSILVGACVDGGPVATDLTDAVAAMRIVNGPAVVEGQTGPGALYELHLPAGWNGDLVLYAHGYRFVDAPIALPNIDALRDGLLGMGFGVAYSSYSQNGFAIKDGVTRTRQLPGLFASNFGRPKNTYIIGHSLGGMVTLMAAEQNRNLFAGAMPLCSLVGGSRLETDYIAHVRMLFDFYYPGVIPGSPILPPEDLDASALIPAIVGAIVGDGFFGALQIAAVEQTSMAFNNLGELINLIVTPLFFNIEGANDLVDRLHGHNGFDNTSTVYSGSVDDAALNAGVARFAATPDALNVLNNWYQPDGNLKIPVLTLHTTRDPLVPAFHEPVYAGIVAAAGNSDLLVQRSIDRFGHCNFSAAEELTAFADLVSWVETGVAPTP